MNTDRIKEIQQETAYPESVSVQQALLKVWNETEQEQLRISAVSRLLLLLDQMIKEENEALGKVGFYNQYGRETHANNKYCLAIVKSLIERRFGNSGQRAASAVGTAVASEGVEETDMSGVELQPDEVCSCSISSPTYPGSNQCIDCNKMRL